MSSEFLDLKRRRKKILITGGAFGNRGAMLMIASAAQMIREKFDAEPVLEVRHGTERQKRQVGVDTLLASGRHGVHFRLPKFHLLDRLPFVLSSEIDAVFDISGFMFGDQWVDLKLNQFARNLDYWAKRVPTYFLPQAFGPFEHTASQARRALGDARIVYARDRTSFEYLEQAVPALADRLRLAPDFTPLLESTGQHEEMPGDSPVVVNWNVSKRVGEQSYLEALERIYKLLSESGRSPYGLCHESGGDIDLLRKLAIRMPEMELVSGLDGVQLQKVIGQAELLVGARYHALVSGLSQSTPSIMHGWSHKYGHLAADFGCSDLLLSPDASESDIALAVKRVTEGNSELRGTLAKHAEGMRAKIESMWDEVYIDLSHQW